MLNHEALPAWAQIDDSNPADHIIVADPAGAYEEALTALGVEERTQYWLEVARRCFTERLLDLLRGNLSLMIAVGATGLHLRIDRGDGSYALANFPEGDGAARGVAEFRQYYQGYLNNLPAV